MGRADGICEVVIKGEIIGWAVRAETGVWTPIVKGWPGEPGAADVAYDAEHAQRIARNRGVRSELVWRNHHYQAVDDLFAYLDEVGGIRTPNGWWIKANGQWEFIDQYSRN